MNEICVLTVSNLMKLQRVVSSGLNHILCSMSMFIACVIHVTVILSDLSEYDKRLCPDMGWCVCSDRSQHILNSHERHVGSILLATPHADCLPSEDLSGQWTARARYELFIVMRRTESEITFIFQHFSLQSHLSNRIVHLKTDNDVGHFVLREFENVFELIHNSWPI